MANTVFDDILGELRMGDTASGGSGGDSLVGGYRTSIAGGTASFVPSADIVTVTGASVTLNPDTAYKIYATTSAVTLNANVPAAGKWAYEGHLEIFVAGTGYIVTGTNVVLANALEPDSVNNCTVRFHDDLAIISVEDHIAGYVVVSATGTTAGTLPYALTSATQEYVAFDASLNGTTIPLAGAVANGEKHLVGNGYNSTTLTGAVDCGENKVTVANLALQNVVVNGGTLTLGDAYIPSGSTVAVSGGGLAVEKVTGVGNDSVIDLNLTGATISGSAYMTGCVVANGRDVYAGVLFTGSAASLTLASCTFSNNMTPAMLGTISASMTLSDCVLPSTQKIYIQTGARVVLTGSNSLVGPIMYSYTGATGYVDIAAGAIVDLTGNTNPTPIAPGGGITFAPGGATVLYSSGAVSGSYMMDNVKLPAGAKLTNTAVVNLGGSDVVPPAGSVAITGATITGGTAAYGGAFLVSSSTNLVLSKCVISGNTATSRGGGIRQNATRLEMYDTIVSGNVAPNQADFVQFYDGVTYLSGCKLGEFSWYTSGAKLELAGSNALPSINPAFEGTLLNVEISSGAIVDLTGNPRGIPVFGGSIVVNGNCTVINSAGESVSIIGGTYTQIKADGTTEPPQA